MSRSVESTPLRKLRDAAGALAAAAGTHGIYVHNALGAGEHDGLLFTIDGVARGVAWFGPRGNLVLISDAALDAEPAKVVAHIRRARWPWRIVLGSSPLVDALAAALGRPVLAHRDQVYCVGDRSTATADLVGDGMRQPQPADRELLARATLQLNASDLNIPPARVDRRWLYDTIDERIRDGSTRVLGPVGGLWSKLDLGSQGSAGTVIEGVFTFPERRGQGHGAALVASLLAECEGPVALHVAAKNRSARSAYRNAGMREQGTCRLLLLG